MTTEAEVSIFFDAARKEWKVNYGGKILTEGFKTKEAAEQKVSSLKLLKG